MRYFARADFSLSGVEEEILEGETRQKTTKPRAFRAGDEITGVAVHRLDSAIRTGLVLAAEDAPPRTTIPPPQQQVTTHPLRQSKSK